MRASRNVIVQFRSDRPIARPRAPAPHGNLKNTIFDHIPAAMVALVIAFWAWGPPGLLQSPWMPTIVSSVVTLVILALESVHERHAQWRMNRREFLTDLFYVVLSTTAIAWASSALADTPLKSLKQSMGMATPWVTSLPFLIQVALVIVVLEFGQYWMHRLMHSVHPFWLTHAPHHHLTQLNAAKGSVGNFVELFLISLSVLALFDFRETALFCGLNVLTVISCFAHANVRSNPPIWYSYIFTTIRHHSLHHSTDYDSTRGNYGNSLILLDRIFGTYRDGEADIVGQGDRRRLGILEQTLFPFRSLVDRRPIALPAAYGPTDRDPASGVSVV